MAHSKKVDTKQLNKNDMNEVKYWSDKLGCSYADLLKAHEEVGNKIEDIKKYLAKHK